MQSWVAFWSIFFYRNQKCLHNPLYMGVEVNPWLFNYKCWTDGINKCMTELINNKQINELRWALCSHVSSVCAGDVSFANYLHVRSMFAQINGCNMKNCICLKSIGLYLDGPSKDIHIWLKSPNMGLGTCSVGQVCIAWFPEPHITGLVGTNLRILWSQ